MIPSKDDMEANKEEIMTDQGEKKECAEKKPKRETKEKVMVDYGFKPFVPKGQEKEMGPGRKAWLEMMRKLKDDNKGNGK